MLKYNSQNPSVRQWRILYRAAIFEPDDGAMAKKLSDAESAMIGRTHELFHDNGPDLGGYVEEEKEALDDAMYALRAFRLALGLGARGAWH